MHEFVIEIIKFGQCKLPIPTFTATRILCSANNANLQLEQRSKKVIILNMYDYPSFLNNYKKRDMSYASHSL